VPKIGDPLPVGYPVLRFQDPERDPSQANECIDIGPGTWLKRRKKPFDVKRVLRCDAQGMSVRWDLGSDDLNATLEGRTQFERVISIDTGIPFFEVVEDPNARKVTSASPEPAGLQGPPRRRRGRPPKKRPEEAA
jgi:hypothetical protein